MRTAALLLLLSCAALAAEPAKLNHLANEQSLYLRQHATNPVDWYPWGPEAWDKAKRED